MHVLACLDACAFTCACLLIHTGFCAKAPVLAGQVGGDAQSPSFMLARECSLLHVWLILFFCMLARVCSLLHA